MAKKKKKNESSINREKTEIAHIRCLPIDSFKINLLAHLKFASLNSLLISIVCLGETFLSLKKTQ